MKRRKEEGEGERKGKGGEGKSSPWSPSAGRAAAWSVYPFAGCFEVSAPHGRLLGVAAPAGTGLLVEVVAQEGHFDAAVGKPVAGGTAATAAVAVPAAAHRVS